MKKRALAVLLSLALIMNISPVVYAEELTATYINPLYEDVFTEEDLEQVDLIDVDDGLLQSAPLSDQEEAARLEASVCRNLEQAGSVMRSNMKNRNTTVQVYLSYDSSLSNSQILQMAHAISDEAMKHSGNSTEGDYIRWQYGGWRVSVEQGFLGGEEVFRYTYTITYYTTLSQENEETAMVNSLRTFLNLAGMSEAQKVETIYNWITSNVTYDYENLGNTSNFLHHTSYKAIKYKTAVCQGFALLFYRLCLEEGIDCRLIAGKGNGAAHGWNIVKVGNFYYNVDSTWDAGKSEPKYYLLCEENFTGHARDGEYNTADFQSKYPMCPMDYNDFLQHEHVPVTTKGKEATCTAAGVTDEITCSVCGEIFQKRTEIPALGHLEVVDAGVEPTEKQTGLTDGRHCSRCGTVLVKQLILPVFSGKKGAVYSDVPKDGGWKYSAVRYVSDNGIMNGTGKGAFTPDGMLTRGMFATMLYRMAGSQKITYASRFSDVPKDRYFSDAVIWGNTNGLINGYGGTDLFGTDDDVTRQDLVVLMYRYAKYRGYRTDVKTEAGSFIDAAEIAGYAKEAVVWAAANGIVNGRGNTGYFDPRGNATRAEAAVIIQRYINCCGR